MLEEIFATTLDMLQSSHLITFQSWFYKVGSSTGASVNRRLDYPFHFVRRKNYDQYWLNMAREAGAEFKAGEAVVTLDPLRNQATTDKGH
ncbi:hypothetical protein D1AOALGA4SA_1165 [Olavius algarvensis Delta 1 endosymbiont]|nr:hypothetical protein D1AOALGA4SA_1165 [Olavius algarvensis Delta 1 endosymbiont]